MTIANNATTTEAQLLLQKYKISATQIAIAANCSQRTVLKAMRRDRFHEVSIPYLVLIREKTGAIISAMGWSGNPEDLWAEYDCDASGQEAA